MGKHFELNSGQVVAIERVREQLGRTFDEALSYLLRIDLAVQFELSSDPTTALEDAGDIAAFDAAMAEGGPSIPWDEVKVDLGWT